MHGAGKVFWSFQSALDECLVDDHLGGHIRQFTSLSGFHLLSHRLKVPLHSINPYRDAVDERERLRVFCKHGREHAGDNVAKLKLGTALTCDPFIPGPPAMFPIYHTSASNSHGLE